jgi:hypothetical protein
VALAQWLTTGGAAVDDGLDDEVRAEEHGSGNVCLDGCVHLPYNVQPTRSINDEERRSMSCGNRCIAWLGAAARSMALCHTACMHASARACRTSGRQVHRCPCLADELGSATSRGRLEGSAGLDESPRMGHGSVSPLLTSADGLFPIRGCYEHVDLSDAVTATPAGTQIIRSMLAADVRCLRTRPGRTIGPAPGL